MKRQRTRLLYTCMGSIVYSNNKMLQGYLANFKCCDRRLNRLQYQPSPKDRLDETFSVENESILYPSCITMSSRTSLKTFLLKEFMLGSFNVSCFGPRRTRGLWRVKRGGPSPPFT